MESPEENAEKPEGVLRLTFTREGNVLHLESAQPVDMVPLPSHERLDPQEQRSGFWIELRDQQDRAVYRRVVPDPRPTWTEVFTGDPAEPFAQYQGGAASNVFVLVVPDRDAARTLVLVGEPVAEAAGAPSPRLASASEIARFDLRDTIERSGETSAPGGDEP